MTIRFHDKQKLAAKDKKRFKVFQCGRRGGKTTYIREDIKAQLFQKETKNLYLANTIDQARAIIWNELKKEIPAEYFRESDLTIAVPNAKGTTSYLTIGSWEKREMYRGDSFDNIYFDELDTMKQFIQGWEDIFRPTLADRLGRAIFAGTPKITNPNLKRLQQINKDNEDWGFYTFTAYDNPQIDKDEIENAKKTLSESSFRQEWMAEYPDAIMALFKPDAVMSLRDNATDDSSTHYLTYDPAGVGNDFNTFAIWKGWELIHVDKYQMLPLEEKIQKVRGYLTEYNIKRNHCAIDAVGVGEDLAMSGMLDGVVPFKSNYKPFKTSQEITALDATGKIRNDKMTSDFQDLRSQCAFWLAKKVNKGDIKVSIHDRAIMSEIEQELLLLTQADNKTKNAVIPKDEVKLMLGRSPDVTDTMIMRAYFDIREDFTDEAVDYGKTDQIMNDMFNGGSSVRR